MASSTQEATLSTSHILFQVAASIKSKAPAATANLTYNTTWNTALQAVQRSLEPVDQQLMLFPRTTKEHQQGLKDLALPVLSTSTTTPSRTFGGLPIKTKFPKHQLPPPSSPAIRTRLQEMTKENMAFRDREPYNLEIQAGTTERFLPTVTGSLRLRGLDSEVDDDTNDCCLDVDDMLWDTGAHICSITEDILPAQFRAYLQSPEHDPYWYVDGLYVQVDGYLALTNSTFRFSSIFQVWPASSLPNGRSGVILGQNGFLNRMVSTPVPRIILKMRGEDVSDDIWGEIHISEYIDVVGYRRTF